MENKKKIKLSSNWTNVGLYGGSALLILMVPVLFFITQKEGFHMGILFAGAMYLALLGFITYQFIYVCDAQIVNDKIILKKKFRTAKSYSFDRIGHPSSFQLKRTKYISVEMKNDDDTLEKYLIVNSNSLLSFENKDAEQVLISLRDKA